MAQVSNLVGDQIYNVSGIIFVGLLTILFIALKLTGVIAWPWLWVLVPIWISFVVWLVLVFMLLGVALLFLR